MNDLEGATLAFLDTNSIDSKSLDVLFAHPDELSKLARIAHITLPIVVFDELMSHKRARFKEDRQNLMNSRLLNDIPGSREKLQELTFDSYKDAMVRNCSIKYDIIRLTNYEAAWARTYDLALHNKAPFNKGSDKGFKDAYIVLAIEEYLEQHPRYSNVLLITGDVRMTEYFSSPESKVKVYKDINAALKSLLLNGADSGGIAENGNDPFESRNVSGISPTKRNANLIDINALIDDLNNSHSFLNTHSIVAKYKDMDISNLSLGDARRILEACINNSQVSYVLTDKDVNRFVRPIFIHYQKSLDDDEYSAYVDALGLPNDRLDASGHVLLSRCESEAYNTFVQGLISHIQSRSFGSSISTDVDEIESQISRLVSYEAIDKNAVTWRDVAFVFIKNGVSASSSKVTPGCFRTSYPYWTTGATKSKQPSLARYHFV